MNAAIRTPPFPRLALTHAFAMAGDALVTMALAGSLFFSISPTAARGRVALSLVLTMAPFAVVAPFLGPAIDSTRRGRRAVAFLTCAGRLVLCVVMADVLQSLLLFPAAFGLLVLSKAYSVTKSSLVPSAVDSPSSLVEANSKLAMVGVLAGFAAAVPGVALLRLADARWVLWLAALAFGAGAAASLRVVERREPAKGGDEAGERVHAVAWSITASAVAMALLRAEVGFLTFLVAFGFRRDGAPSWWFGVVLAASMGATLGGAAVAPRLRRVLVEERLLAGAVFLVAAAGIVASRLEGRIWAAAVAAAVGLAAGSGKLAFDSLVQRDAPDAARGRSFARFEAGFQLVWVVGALLPVVVATPLTQGYLVIGIGALGAGIAYSIALGRLRRGGRRPAVGTTSS